MKSPKRLDPFTKRHANTPDPIRISLPFGSGGPRVPRVEYSFAPRQISETRSVEIKANPVAKTKMREPKARQATIKSQFEPVPESPQLVLIPPRKTLDPEFLINKNISLADFDDSPVPQFAPTKMCKPKNLPATFRSQFSP